MKEAIALVIVWGITIVIALLAIGAIYLMGNQALVAEHKIRRIQAYYTAKAGVIHALEELRRGRNPDNTSITLNSMQADITVNPTSPYLGCSTVSVTVDYSR
ncbi:MAG TPA: hypothetical protein ENI31_03390 [Candidatus Omnitrophica bacterium]|nr:MAG: hypothetical protein DRP61_00100 [Candidatus Omnitrophota bacterium]RKY44874.1 MAG: hypothetical protein DRP80_00765 [Candidatus Omnitrophota bacterium]HEC69314.1 hypothetical protein [Candidatus Omnitrophota bacterium]